MEAAYMNKNHGLPYALWLLSYRQCDRSHNPRLNNAYRYHHRDGMPANPRNLCLIAETTYANKEEDTPMLKIFRSSRRREQSNKKSILGCSNELSCSWDTSARRACRTATTGRSKGHRTPEERNTPHYRTRSTKPLRKPPCNANNAQCWRKSCSRRQPFRLKETKEEANSLIAAEVKET